ncbi:MAG TPA: BadF/BadG/BcrA/BcrD ATPase family protein [Roseiarcus sp.]|jgi:glucosamine kinase
MSHAPSSRLYFCVDAGGTRSRARIIDSEGRSLAAAESGPCNPATHFEQAVESINHLWAQCATAIGRQASQCSDVVFAIGAAGTYLHGRDRFLAACPPFVSVCAMSDGYAALIGAGSGEPCSLLLVGTGVAGHRLYPNGLSIQRDAWGWIAGDRGSGSWMGQRALRHFFAAVDGVVPHDDLACAVERVIGGAEAIRAGWMRDLGPSKLGSFAPIVLAEADKGNAAAVRIRERALEHLCALIGVISGDSAPLYAAGGLVAPLRAALSKKAARPILEPEGDALTGCWLVASGGAPEERALLFGENMELPS